MSRSSILLRRYLYLTVLISGAAALALELSASRLLGPFFGTGNIVWASVIGLTLLYLTAGYFIGGRWADRTPTPVRFYQIVAWGALWSGLIPFAARPVLPLIASLGLSVGLASALSMLILFTIPMTLLGCVSPFAIRLALQSVEQAGQTAGRLYAVSTLGSVIGSLTPVLLLLPEAGTQATFLMVSGSLLGVALVGLALARKQQALTHG